MIELSMPFVMYVAKYWIQCYAIEVYTEKTVKYVNGIPVQLGQHSPYITCYISVENAICIQSRRSSLNEFGPFPSCFQGE